MRVRPSALWVLILGPNVSCDILKRGRRWPYHIYTLLSSLLVSDA
jgi:hypothetical protein